MKNQNILNNSYAANIFIPLWLPFYGGLKTRSDSHAFHIDISFGFVQALHCGVNLFGPSCQDGPPLS